MTGMDVVVVITVAAADDDEIAGNVTKPFIEGFEVELLLSRCFRPFDGDFFFGDFGLDDVAVVGDASPDAISASLLFLDGIDADGGPWTGTPASLDLLQWRLM